MGCCFVVFVEITVDDVGLFMLVYVLRWFCLYGLLRLWCVLMTCCFGGWLCLLLLGLVVVDLVWFVVL